MSCIVQLSQAKLLKPQRLVPLTLNEEKHRAQCGWAQFDRMLWLSCFGSKEQLKPHVLDVEYFVQHRSELVVVMNDQVPLWVKVRAQKQLFAEWEVQKNRSERNKLATFAPLRLSQKPPELSKDMVPQGEEAEELKAEVEQVEDAALAEVSAEKAEELKDYEGMSQLRGVEHCDAEHFRITIDMHQEFYHIPKVEIDGVSEDPKVRLFNFLIK